MAQYVPVSLKPAQDGRLITRASEHEVPLAAYSVKRDWRRDLDAEFRREGIDYFVPNQDVEVGGQPFPNGATEEELTLVHLARRPNGKTAVIVGTKGKLWRFFANEDGTYALPDYIVNQSDYIVDLTGAWLLIGSGFSSDGKRWEALNFSGTTIFNNGVDLPQAYRLEWDRVRPLYELREAGIASVGTIAEDHGILLIGDVREMQAGTLETQLAMVDSGAITAAQAGAPFSAPITANVPLAGTTVTASAPIFALGDVGKIIRFTDGFVAIITVFTDAMNVDIDRPANPAVVARPFWITNAAAHVVVASAAIFAASDVGREILWDTGEVRTILSFTSPTQVSVDLDFAIAGGPFVLENLTGYDPVTTFVDRIQYRVAWSIPDDPTRWGPIVPAAATAGSNAITLLYPLKSLSVGDEITVVGAGVSGGNLTTTIVAILELGRILRVADAAATSVGTASSTASTSSEDVLASVIAGSTSVTTTKAFFSASDVGRSIRFSDGDFQATIAAYVSSTEITLSVAPDEDIAGSQFFTGETGMVIRSDVTTSILGYEDLQGDGSGILRMLSLDQTLVIYKDTDIYLAAYTGIVAAPWAFTSLKTPSDKTLFYRWTLVNIQGDFHIYAGKNSFFRFDLTSRVPRLIDAFELVSNLFFDPTDPALDIDKAWAAVNAVTNEAWFHIPDEESADKFICWDYRYNTMSTTTIDVTAAATVKRPTVELQVAQTDDWFVMGNAESVVLTYGLSSTPQDAWAGARSIYYRRGSNPYDDEKNGYESILTSGLSDFLAPTNEKDMDSYTPYLASQHQGIPLPEPMLEITLYGTSNPMRDKQKLGKVTLSKPYTQNLVPTFFREHYLQAELKVTGFDNPVRYSGASWLIAGIPSKGVVRSQS